MSKVDQYSQAATRDNARRSLQSAVRHLNSTGRRGEHGQEFISS